jgi:hypothetical protein
MIYGDAAKLLGRGETEATKITLGQVVNTNDPDQAGRVQVFCANLGDQNIKDIRDVPWAMPVTPFNGVITHGTRGREDSPVNGANAYGFFAVPKLNSWVVVACLNGDTSTRIWLGCLSPHLFTHTLPHGAYAYQNQNGLPDGPFASGMRPLEPMYTNYTTAFTKAGESLVGGTPSEPRRNMEWRTRGVDTAVTALNPEMLNFYGFTQQFVQPDDFNYTFTEENGDQRNIFCTGYDKSREFPNKTSERSYNQANYDPQTYTFTSPGMHSLSMDDRNWNCRVRLRTTGGHQVIMDDTNERIYISTAQGQTWIEIDEKGTIDIYSMKDLSIRAGGDINMTSDQTIRMHAKQGIHLQTPSECRIHSGADLHMKTDANARLHASADVKIQSGGDAHIKSGGRGLWTAGSTLNYLSGGNTVVQGAEIHLNGPAPDPADVAGDAAAFWTSRVPEHEPWARTYMDKSADGNDGNGHKPEYTYTDKNVGKSSAARGIDFSRNPKWHR